MNIRKIIKEEVDSFDWVNNTGSYGSRVTYEFEPGLSISEYKNVLKMISDTDDSIRWESGTKLVDKMEVSDVRYFNLKGGIHAISINEKNEILVSYTKPPTLKLMDDGTYEMKGRRTEYLDPNDEYDLEIIEELNYERINGREFFNLS